MEKNVKEWLEHQSDAGFTGFARILTEGSDIAPSDETREVNAETKTIESKTAIPLDMLDHMQAIFAERDRLWNEAHMMPWEPGNELFDKFNEHSVHCPELPRGAVMNAILLPIAIENVRQRLKGADHDDAEGNAKPGAEAGSGPSSEGTA